MFSYDAYWIDAPPDRRRARNGTDYVDLPAARPGDGAVFTPESTVLHPDTMGAIPAAAEALLDALKEAYRTLPAQST